jgi:hypothetical protein
MEDNNKMHVKSNRISGYGMNKYGSGQWSMADYGEHNCTSGSTTDDKILEYLSEYR